LYATAAVRPRVVEIGCFNTSATAVSIAIRRLTTTGTQGATVTAINQDDETQTAIAVPKDTHTVGPTVTAGSLRVATLGGAVGSGVIWTFQEPGLIVPAATTNGICLVPFTGTGQICDVSFTWVE
jgi:hypothetical protein